MKHLAAIINAVLYFEQKKLSVCVGVANVSGLDLGLTR